MYKATIFTSNGKECGWYHFDYAPNYRDEYYMLLDFPEGYYVDICRIPHDMLSDTANFRHEVEVDLEPFILEELP